MKKAFLKRMLACTCAISMVCSTDIASLNVFADTGDETIIVSDTLKSGSVTNPDNGMYTWGEDFVSDLTENGLLLTNLNSSKSNYADRKFIDFTNPVGDTTNKVEINYDVAFQQKSKGQDYSNFIISYYNENNQFMFSIAECIGMWADNSTVTYTSTEGEKVSETITTHIGSSVKAECSFDDTYGYLSIDGNTYKFMSNTGIKYVTLSVDGGQDYNRGIYVSNYSLKTIETELTEYATVTYTVNDVISNDTVVAGSQVDIEKIPNTDYAGFIFKGWQVNDDENNIITTDELISMQINDNISLKAIYEVDEDYIEPIVSVELIGAESMTFGQDTDTAASNNYTLKLIGEKGTIITSENYDKRVDDFVVEWDIDGFKTENDLENQYCDSYGEFAPHNENATSISFMLRQVSFNFYGKLTAKVTYNGAKYDTSMYVIALGDKSADKTQVLPKSGYPSDFDVYPDSIVGYNALRATYGGNDLIVGGWAMTGSDSGNATIMNEDGNKFIRLEALNSKKSHMFANIIDSPATQVIFEQDVRFNNVGGCITLTSKYPFYSSDYTNPVTLKFNGSTITLNETAITKNDVGVDISINKWYKVVLSVDKTTESCFAKIYDTDGNFLGGTENVAWTETSTPTFYSVGFSNNDTGTVDFDNYKAYYPVADVSSYTISASQETLSIPNGDLANLSASVKTKDGYDVTGNAVWSITDEDVQGIVITPDETDSHKATVTLADGAAAGDVTVQVNINGYVKTINLSITDSAESIKFVSSQSSLSIPLDMSSEIQATYSAMVIDGTGTDLKKDVSLSIYDKNNTNVYILPNGISFNSETGLLKVTAEAVPCTFTIRATGLNSSGETISKSVKVTVHGLSFDFGSGNDGSLVEGYTEVSPATAYSQSRGYGIEGTATANGIDSDSDIKADYLEGSFKFKANVTAGKVYKVTVAFSGDLVTEYVSDVLTGHERTLEAEGTTHTGYTLKTTDIEEQVYEIPVVDEVLDLTFTNAKVAYITIEKIEKIKTEKPSIYSVGDSTLGNNGSYGYVLARDQANYPELTKMITKYNNNGKGSRNLSTYYNQGWLDNILSSIKPGDIVTVGNMGTNPGGLSGSLFKAPLDYYVDACIKMGAKVILTSYTPHGAVAGYDVYDATTHTFHGCRTDAYDTLGIRKIYEERKDDPSIMGFIDIGKNADDSFNKYVKAYEKNGYNSEDEAANAIIACFGDHNHYNKGTIACELMLNGYDDIPGIVSEMVRIISENDNTISISDVSIENDNISFNLNNAEKYSNVSVYVAEYNNEQQLMGLKQQNINIETNKQSVEIPYVKSNNDNKINIFIWDDLNPIINKYSI